ncbi:MAG: response regulator [Acidaminobacteraceae bacterium]
MYKILLVDDAAFMRMILRNIIGRRDDVIIYEGKNGREGIEQYKLYKPDLMFMDVTMPEIDGIEALKVIKVMDKNARVIICSAMGQQPYIIDAIKSGALDYIVKPFKIEKIEEVLEKYLKKIEK